MSRTCVFIVFAGCAALTSFSLPAATIRIEAEDSKACHVEGKTFVFEHPRSTGTQVLYLTPGARLVVSGTGRAVYLCLPPVFHSPGPRYDSAASARLRFRVDDRPLREIAMATVRRVVPLAEELPEAGHRVEIELVAGAGCGIDAFLFAAEPLAAVQGVIASKDYSELLTDVRAELVASGKVVRTDYVRNPVNGTFDIVGLEPGTYRLRLSAHGWLTSQTEPFAIDRTGQKVDLGVIDLAFDSDVAPSGWTVPTSARHGHTSNIWPGGSFCAQFELPGDELKSVRLVSRYKTIELTLADQNIKQIGGDHAPLVTVTCVVPPSARHDMYSLQVTGSRQGQPTTNTWCQAVCVREPLPRTFAIAGVGHMNTWGQQTSEYLARVAEAVQLAGARMLLIANEVNPAYIAGALRELRIPYLATAGNHTMARWEDFFGPQSVACDDGPMRIVTFGDLPTASWHEVRRLIGARDEATARVLLCYEAYAPIDLIHQEQVDLLFDGHSYEDHPQRSQFPQGTFHLRPPLQESVRWIGMTHEGVVAAESPKDVPTFLVPRQGPVPLRVEYSAPNDGSCAKLTAHIINETTIPFPQARIRFIMLAATGDYAVSEGKIEQQFRSDDGRVQIVDVAVRANAKSDTEVAISSESLRAARRLHPGAGPKFVLEPGI